jgi:hypothetical protein
MQRDGQRDRVGGDRKSLSRRPTMKLPGLGITRDQSSQWQALAAWPGSRRPVSGDQKPTTFHTLSIHGPGVLGGAAGGRFRIKKTHTFPELFPNHCPHALSEPYLNLSAHTAPAMEPRRTPICQCAHNFGSRLEIRATQCVALRKWPRSFLYFR